MKYPLSPSTYSFNASAKTITFSGTVPENIGNILQVTNITRGVLYFQPQAGLDYSGSYAEPVLTLLANTTGHSNSDNLLIIYDDGLEGATLDSQIVGNVLAASIDEKLPGLISGRIPVDVGTSIDIGEVEINNDSGNPVPISATSLPLPSGAATEAKQDAGNTSLSSIDSSVGSKSDAAASTDTGTFSLIALVKRGLQNWTTLLSRIPALVSGRIPVDGSGVTQPISGTVTATGPLTDAELRASAILASVASLPLPTGAATSDNQTTANNSLASLDGKSPALVSGRIPVDGSGVTQPVSGTVTATGPLTNTELRATAVPISASSLPLPTGAATSDNQTTANTSLASIAGLTIPAHDYISLGYTGTNLTSVVYKTGGSGGTTVATLTLTYSGSSLISVTKS